MRIFTALFLMAFAFKSFAQDFSYKQYTTADGLSSNVVYSTFQDNEGYIWFCTTAGVSRFNGVNFKNYTVKDGLSDNEVFKAFQTKSGKIFFITFNGKNCYFEKGRFHNEKTDHWLKRKFPAYNNLYLDKHAHYWTFFDSMFVLNDQHKSIKQINSFRGKEIVITDHLMDTISTYENKKLGMEIAHFYKDNQKVIEGLPHVRAYVLFVKKYINEIMSKKFPSINPDYIYQILIKQSVPEFRFYEFSYPQLNDRIWLSHEDRGIISIKDLFDMKEKPIMYLPEKTINHFNIDKEGNYWFSSNGEGVFLLNSSAVKNYHCEPNSPEIYSVTGNNKYIFAGKNNKVLVLNKANEKKVTLTLNSFKTGGIHNRVKDLLINGDKLWVASDVGGFCFNISGLKYKDNSTQVLWTDMEGAFKCITKESNGKVYLGTHAELLLVDEHYNTKILQSKRITSIAVTSPGHLLLGSTDGLHTYFNRTLKNYSADNEVFKKSIMDIERMKNGIVCVATNDIGLIILKDNKYFCLTASDSLPLNKRLSSDICKKLFIDARENIWVCTNRGLCRIKVTSWNPFNYTVQHITTDDGLFSDDVNDVYVDQDTIWVATMRGLNVFRHDQIKSRGSHPLTYISNRDSISNRSFPFGLPVSIALEGISYESLGKIKYRYKLKGLNKEWQSSDKHEIRYEVLPPGDYEFKAYCINRFGQKSFMPAVVTFTVLPPWWQSYWAFFYYIIAFIALFSSAIYLVKQTSRIREKAKIKHLQQLQQLELKALRAQMNPHFIFNTINSIQKYILENDSELSYRYLSKFSKLMRNFLEHSRQASITLEQEFDLLNSYIDIEILRFRNKFTYELKIDPMLNPAQIHIPSMLIQPYVENAIWHGIQNKSGNGLVKIGVSFIEAGILKCSIEDNGIGRRMAKEIAAQSNMNHQPVGMTITQQRLELINQRLKDDAVSVNFIDLTDTLGKGCGTRVELIITYSTEQNYDFKSSNY